VEALGKKEIQGDVFNGSHLDTYQVGTIKVRITLAAKMDDVFILVHAKKILVLASI
jgi:hypothetical protein